MAKLKYLAVEFLTQRPRGVSGSGAHTPIRQDGFYAELEDAREIADFWREENRHNGASTVAVLEVIEIGKAGRQ